MGDEGPALLPQKKVVSSCFCAWGAERGGWAGREGAGGLRWACGVWGFAPGCGGATWPGGTVAGAPETSG